MILVLVKVDFSTGYRSGNINPRKNTFLPVAADWQNLQDGYEIRICETAAAVDHIRALIDSGVEGLTLLETDAELDAALDQYIYVGEKARTRYQTADPALAIEFVRQAGIDLTPLQGERDPEAWARHLYDAGVPGVMRHEPRRIRAADVRERRERIERQRAQANAAREQIKAKRRYNTLGNNTERNPEP